MKHLFVLIALFVGFVPAVTLRAENAAAIQQRMQSRLSEVDALKQKGVVGENNRGFLEAKGSLSGEQASLLSAENADRGEVYAELARRTSSSAESVGKVRAKKIAENSAKGIWLQNEAGSWYRK